MQGFTAWDEHWFIHTDWQHPCLTKYTITTIPFTRYRRVKYSSLSVMQMKSGERTWTHFKSQIIKAKILFILYSPNVTVEKNQNSFLIASYNFLQTAPFCNFLTDHFRVAECLNYPEGSPLAHAISIQHSLPPVQVRTPRRTRCEGEHSRFDRTFSHFNFTLSGFVINMEIKNEWRWRRSNRGFWAPATTKWAMTSLFHISSSLVSHHVIWLLISLFRNEKEGFVMNVWRLLLAKGAYGNWGPSERLPKKCLTECGRFNYSSHMPQVWKPLGSKPPPFEFDSSQVKVCEEGVCVRFVGGLN